MSHLIILLCLQNHFGDSFIRYLPRIVACAAEEFRDYNCLYFNHRRPIPQKKYDKNKMKRREDANDVMLGVFDEFVADRQGNHCGVS